MKVSFFYLKLSSNPEMNDNYYTGDGEYCPIIDMIEYVNKEYGFHDTDIYLYGFTEDKILADIFEQLHDPNIIIRVDKKISKSEFNTLISESSDLRISQYSTVSLSSSYKFDNKVKEYIVATELEISCIEDEFTSSVDEDIMEITCVPYEQFKSKYIHALDVILYCTYNKMYSSDSDDSDQYSYNFSYGCTAEGLRGIRTRVNMLNLYVLLFKPILRKEEFG